MQAKAPKLTIMIPARNDNFMENFRYRLSTTLEIMAESAEATGRLDDLEILVCDWGSEQPLHKEITLSETAKKIVRFLIVPPSVAVKVQGDSEFPIVLCQNAAIRRARGEYVMQTDSDVVFSPFFMQEVWKLLDDKRSDYVDNKKALISSRRRHIPWEIVAMSLPKKELLEVCSAAGMSFPAEHDSGFGYCATGMMVMHKDVWHECTGYDERLIHWGWMEIDLGFRVTQRYPWFDVTSNFRMWVFHMEHYKPDKGRVVTRQCNPQIMDNQFAPNAANWGLADYDLEVWSFEDGAAMGSAPATELAGQAMNIF